MDPPETNLFDGQSQRPQRNGKLHPAVRWTAPLGLALLSFLVRAMPATTVYASDRVTFFGMDAYYHMRRVAYGLARFPESLTFDPYINFPHGAKPIWPPFFDAAVSLGVLPFYTWGGIEAAESAAVWIPPLLGTATVLVLYFLALRFFGFPVALLSGLLLAVSSGHYWFSQVGFLDHHAAVALTSTIVLASSMGLLAQLEDPRNETSTTRMAVTTGLAMALAFLVWPGSLLHVALAEAGFLLYIATRKRIKDAAQAAGAVCWVNAIAAAVIAPWSWGNHWPQWSDFSPAVLSNFQPWFLAALALYALVLRGTWTRGQDRGALRRLGDQGVLAALVVGASLFLFPGLLDSFGDAWQWLSKDEAFQASVAESQPLLMLDGKFSLRIAEGRLSRFIYILPLALFALAASTRTRKDRAAIGLLVLWTVGLVAVTLVQRRFFNSLSISMAIVFAWTAVVLYRAIVGRTSGMFGKTLGVLATGAAVIFLLIPMIKTYQRPVENLTRMLRGQPLIKRSAGPNFPALLETAQWIRENTPPTSGFLDVSQSPEYSVLALSGNGHLIEYVGRRPTVTNNFGDDIGAENYRLVQRYFAARSEAEAEAIANDLGARYVVATLAGPRKPRSGPVPILRQLADEDGQGLGGHRLVFEASGIGPGARPSDPIPKVFERVAGARITGMATPGEPVTADLELRTNRGRRILYRARTITGPEGRYILRLPYANTGGQGLVQTASHYRVRSQGVEDQIRVDERQVVHGDSTAGPNFGS